MLDIKHLKRKIKHYIYYNTKDKSFQIVKKKSWYKIIWLHLYFKFQFSLLPNH